MHFRDVRKFNGPTVFAIAFCVPWTLFIAYDIQLYQNRLLDDTENARSSYNMAKCHRCPSSKTFERLGDIILQIEVPFIR